jgi:hypothetical protein
VPASRVAQAARDGSVAESCELRVAHAKRVSETWLSGAFKSRDLQSVRGRTVWVVTQGYGLFIAFAGIVVIVMLVSGISDMADARWFASNGITVSGEIVDVRVKWTNTMVPVGNGVMAPNSHRRYVPTVRFTTTSGQVMETRTKPSGWRPGRPGDQVQVSYDPADPTHVRLLR